jgi:hypothetical protein
VVRQQPFEQLRSFIGAFDPIPDRSRPSRSNFHRSDPFDPSRSRFEIESPRYLREQESLFSPGRGGTPSGT